MESVVNKNSIFNNIITDKLNEISVNKNGIQLTVAISLNGQREYRLWGADGELTFRRHLYEIGSITKTFTGLLVAKAITLGKADFDSNIATWFPEITTEINLPTVGQLVTHSAGFPSSDDENYINIDAVNPFYNITRTDLIDSLKKIKCDESIHTPVYSNFGASLTGVLLERIFDKSYGDLMQDLFSDFGLEDTIVYSTENIGLYGYNESGERCDNWYWSETSAYAPAGSLVSTASDMLNYSEVILKNDKQYVSLSTNPRVLFSDSETSRLELGCFWFCLSDYDILYHNGITGCFNSALAIDKKEKNAMIILSNCHMPDKGNFVLSLIESLRKEK